MLSVVKQQGEVLTVFHTDLARKLESGLVHEMNPDLEAQYRPDDKSISVMVGPQKVKMRVKPTMDEDYLDFTLHAHVSMMCARSSDGNYTDKVSLQLEFFFAHSS